MGKFIILEGLDGSGKTQISQLLAKRLDAEWIATPGKALEPIRNKINNGMNLSVRLHYYMIGNMLAAEKAQNKLLQGHHVICDRYVDSTLVYFEFFYGQKINPAPWDNYLYCPDIKIFLDVSFEERMRRLKKRTNNTQEDNLTTWFGQHQHLRNLYMQRPNMVVVDTDLFSNNIQKEVDYLLQIIRSH